MKTSRSRILAWLARLKIIAINFLILFASSIFLITSVQAEDDNESSGFITKPGPPPGFEELAGPQTTAIDIFYGEKFLGSVLATYTPETIEFESAEQVVSLIPRVSNTAEVEAALRGPLTTNTHRICLSEVQRDCGYLEPAVAGVIFDESYFRLHIFINALYLEDNVIVRSKYLAPSTTEFSTVNLISSTVSGSDNENSYTFGANHIAAHKQSRLQLEWDYSDTRSFSVENLSAQHDEQNWAAEAGIFDSTTNNSNFISEVQLLGGRIFSSTNTRTDLETSQSTEIFLFFSTPSLVEIFKDEKLVTAFEYEAGNQQIDTSYLPGGSYPITLRITDARGSVREETYFFVKSALLPPKDQPLYFAEFGQIGTRIREDTFPEYSDEFLGKLGIAYRILDNFGVDVEVLYGAEEGILQGGAIYLGNNYNLFAGLMQSSESKWGVNLRGQYTRQKLNLAFDYREVKNDENFSLDNEVQLIPNSFTQSSISASTVVANGSLSIRGKYNKRINQEGVESIGIEYRKPIFEINRYRFDLTTSAFNEDDSYSGWIGFAINRFSGNNFISSDMRYTYEDNGDSTEQGAEFNGAITHTNISPTLGNYSIGLFANDNNERSSIGTRGRSHSSLGRSDFSYEFVDDKSSGNFSRYFGNASFSAFSSGKKFAWGGNRTADAGVIVDLESEASDTPFEIFVNRQPQGFAKSGKANVIGLQGYGEYEVQIKPRGNEIVHYDDIIRTVTLYPGNVETLNWKVSPVTVLISNAVLSDGTPVANAKFENTISFASTDNNGWFQIEIASRDPLILSKQGKPICQIDLPPFESEQGIAVIDELSCVPIQDSLESRY